MGAARTSARSTGFLRRLLGSGWSAPIIEINGRRYQFVEQLTEAGNGMLHVAVDDAGRRFVLKRPTTSLDGEDESLFDDEFRILSSLHHRNIVSAVDFGFDTRSGLRYIVMEYVRGRRLWESVKGIGESEVSRHFLESLQVCDYLAKRGIAHCDLKPDNMLVAEDHSIRISDFGVATRHGIGIKGLSPAFVAPEHLFASEAAPAGSATDLFSLGVSFYWLLTGAHPYFSDDEPVYYQQARLAVRPAAPTSLNPTISPKWDFCLSGLIDIDPGRRVSTAARILAAPDHELPARS